MPPRSTQISFPDPIKLNQVYPSQFSWKGNRIAGTELHRRMLVGEAGNPHGDEGTEGGDAYSQQPQETAKMPPEAKGQVATGSSLDSLERNKVTNP